mgnify:CR=1 FL=1
MSKKFEIKIKRGAFKETQEKFLEDNKILNENVGGMVTLGALNNPFPSKTKINEEADYEHEVNEAVGEFYSDFGEGGYLDVIGQTVEAFWNDENAPKAIKLLEMCSSEMWKVIQKYNKKIGRL